MANKDIRSKVFISCGQRKNTSEIKIARIIADLLIELGFDPYIAVEEQTLRGVKENIFQQLETSEYFIFIDFKRERITTNNEKIHRGSLFSHQELAIASFLDKNLIALQEDGVKKDDGLIAYLQGNSLPFKKREDLPTLISKMIKEFEWNPNWKNQLSLKTYPTNFADAKRIPENLIGRFFHIDVDNLNPYSAAFNCYGYIEKITNLDNGKELDFEMTELKWKGYTYPNALIRPNGTRKLDAFWIKHSEPQSLNFNVFADYGGFLHGIKGGRRLEFTFSVISENFPPTSRVFIIEYGPKLEDVKIYHTEL